MSETDSALREPWVAYDEQRAAAHFGMWLFIVSEILFFGAFFMAFVYLRHSHADAFRLASSHTNLKIGAANTVILLTSSFTMSLGLRAAALDLRQSAVAFFALTIGLGCAFLCLKGLEYRDDFAQGLFPGASFAIKQPGAVIFFSAYWAITVIHVLHLSIGIGIVIRLVWSIALGRLSLYSPQIEAAAVYWSFVDIVWIILFPLLYLEGPL